MTSLKTGENDGSLIMGRIKNERQNSKTNHMVYVAKSNSGVVLYVGEGANDRHLHCTSGVSHVYELNKMHFTGQEIVVDIIKEGIDKNEALDLEAELIKKLKPLFNKIRLGDFGGINYSSTKHNIRKELSDKSPKHLKRGNMVLFDDMVKHFGITKIISGISMKEMRSSSIENRSRFTNTYKCRHDYLQKIFDFNTTGFKLKENLICNTGI